MFKRFTFDVNPKKACRVHLVPPPVVFQKNYFLEREKEDRLKLSEAANGGVL